MKKTCMSVAVASALTLLSHSLYAGESVIVLGEIPVTAQGKGPLLSNNILTSVDVLGGDQVQDKNVMNSWELVGQMPGIQLTETRMGAESGKATFRAFNGEGYINGIKVLIDGIPSNINSGNQRFIDMIFPLEIDYIEVVRGTNDPRYGLHNIGGNINLGTRQGGNYLESRLTYGSYNTREAQVVMGREADGFAQNYFFAWQESDGYRDHSHSEKYSAGAKWFLDVNNDLKAGLVVRAYTHKAEEAGFLTAAEMATNRRQSPHKNANDGDDRDMGHVSAHLDWQVTPDVFFSNKLYFNTYQDDRRVTFTSNPSGNAPRQQRLWDEDQLGYLGALTWNMNEKLIMEGGLNVERQDNHYRRLRFNHASPTDFSTPARTQNDDHFSLNNVGAYVQAIYKPADSLKIVPGFRMDRFSGSSRINSTGISSSLQDYGWINQPKLSVVYSPRKDMSIYANWGRTFQILTGSTAPAYLTTGQATYKPSINTGTELGIKFKPMAHADMRVAVWQQDATDEVANMPSTGTTVGLGQTRRSGMDFQLSGQATDKLNLWLSHSLQKAKVVSAFSGSQSLAGKEVFSTPRYITNIGADYRASDKWHFGLQGRSQGSYYIDELNTAGKFGGFTLWDANARYTATKNFSIDFQIKNLANRKYEYVWYDNFFWPTGSEQAMYSSGPGRAFFVSMNLKM